jgi:selenocysteine lyase/cysteine desulfurase
VSPLPAPTAAAARKWCDEAVHDGAMSWMHWSQRVEATRDSAARLIGAGRDEIALVPNTSAGISLVAEGIDWHPGDNVVTLADEFPANVYPWLNLASRGVETRRVPTDNGRLALADLAAACDARTRVVSVSWIGYASGCRQDLDQIAAIAHEHRAYFMVDAIQGLGVFPLDVRQTPIDFLAAEGRKWMLSPEGTGLLFIRREHLDRLRPLGIGWHSVVHASDYTRIELNFKPSADRYEGGAQNMVGMIGFGASLELLLGLGTEAVAAAILDITDQACQRLQKLGATIVSDRSPERRSGIVAFELPGREPLAVRKHCLTRNVVLSCRAGRLRISPHAYNNEEDLERLIEALESYRA